MKWYNRYVVMNVETGGEGSGAGEEVIAPVAEDDAGPAVELDIGIAKPPVEGKGEPLIEAPEGSVVVYNETGDPGLDMALGFIGKLGLGPDHPTVTAARNGDFTFLKAHLAGLGEKATGWEQYIALAERAYTSRVETTKAEQEKTKGIVLNTVGGEEAWVEIQAWARDNADDGERAQINSMLAQGGMAAQAAAMLLSNLYSKATGGVQEPQSATRDVPANTPKGGNGALSPAEYAKEVEALSKRVGAQRVDGHPDYAKLKQRRQQYRG